MKDINRFSDLRAEGWGTRNTINKMIRDGKFPPPMDINGRPGWYREQLEALKKSFKEYTPKTPEQLKKHVQPQYSTA